MPTYGYRCTECGNDFDVWQRMSDEPGAACPRCGAPGKRLFFPAGIVFKGSGFYKTDSRGSENGASSRSSSSSSSPSTSGESTEGKSDKPDGVKAPDKSDKAAPAAPAGGGDKGS